MFYRTIFVCLVGFDLAKSAEGDPPEITFQISSTKDNHLVCDHKVNNGMILQHTYTVREGESFTLITKYTKYINHLICSNYNGDVNDNSLYNYIKKSSNFNGNIKYFTFKVEKRMGALWNCSILSHRNNPTLQPVVHYKDANYSVASCFMKIHVRQTKSPQTILVNNMVLQTVRTDLSEKDVDFTAEYQYADGDVVNVTCANYLNQAQLTIAGTTMDMSTMKKLSAQNAIGFRAKLGSGHSNSYMICTNTEPTDYTKVRVRFVMRTEFNSISIKINGMTLRPKLTNELNNHYEIEYKYLSNQLITVVCEVRTDLMLVVTDSIDFAGKVSSYRKKELKPNKKAEMTFHLEPREDGKKLQCAADSLSGKSAEQVGIHFTAGNFPIDQYPLRMELPSNGTAMELYSDYKLKVLFYEFEDGETVQFKCGPLSLRTPGPVLILQLNDSQECKTNHCDVYKTLNVTRKDENTKIVCYLKERIPKEEDKVLREVRVILRERVLTTTSSSTTTTTTTSITMGSRETENSTGSPSSELGDKDEYLYRNMLPAVISIVVLCIIIVCISIVIVKLRKRNHSQGGPHNRNYENLQSPSEASIPAYPPQWESNYAVPVDRRTEDTTYSVPCQDPVLYSTPIPKNLRNKKQKPVDPTYAVLDVATAGGRKNTFRETDDPNYSEVYANRQEERYAKVVPKSERKNMPKDEHPYAYVSNEPAYVNTAEPEPMYCEPAKAQGGTYANLNNSHYANSHAQDYSYVEPTYCEPQTRKK